MITLGDARRPQSGRFFVTIIVRPRDKQDRSFRCLKVNLQNQPQNHNRKLRFLKLKFISIVNCVINVLLSLVNPFNDLRIYESSLTTDRLRDWLISQLNGNTAGHPVYRRARSTLIDELTRLGKLILLAYWAYYLRGIKRRCVSWTAGLCRIFLGYPRWLLTRGWFDGRLKSNWRAFLYRRNLVQENFYSSEPEKKCSIKNARYLDQRHEAILTSRNKEETSYYVGTYNTTTHTLADIAATALRARFPTLVLSLRRLRSILIRYQDQDTLLSNWQGKMRTRESRYQSVPAFVLVARSMSRCLSVRAWNVADNTRDIKLLPISIVASEYTDEKYIITIILHHQRTLNAELEHYPFHAY